MRNAKIFVIPFFIVVSLNAQNVRFNIAAGCNPATTVLGGIDVTLTPSTTPQTVANFMSYVNSGAYDCTIIHRSTNTTNNADNPPYVIQGGGYALNGLVPYLIPQNPPVTNEYSAPNTAGTLAMALYNGETDSGTDQWFFNVQDNSASIDSGDYTVFGNVANDAGMGLVNTINGLTTWSEDFGADADFPDLPLWTNYSCPNSVCPLVKPDNFIFVTSIATIGAPAVTAPGVADAATALNNNKIGISPGEIITLYGTNFGSSTAASYMGPTETTTLTLNSAGSVNTNLEGTQVTFNGTPGAMDFTSDSQIAVVVPYEIANSGTVNVVVSYLGGSSTSMQFNVVPTTPGLFTLSQTGQGDAAIIRASDTSVISASNPASAGDSLQLYGEGYGVATSNTALPDGAVVSTILPVPAAQTTLLIDGKAIPSQNCTAQSGCLQYAGGAGGDVNGVMQINFLVPQLTPGEHQLQVQIGSATSPTGVTLATQ